MNESGEKCQAHASGQKSRHPAQRLKSADDLLQSILRGLGRLDALYGPDLVDRAIVEVPRNRDETRDDGRKLSSQAVELARKLRKVCLDVAHKLRGFDVLNFDRT